MAADTLERIKTALGDRYAIERELGRGGMATVYLGQDIKHEREVAIKVLHPELAASIGSERFEREIKLAAKLQHPHILGLYDSGEADGLLFYVMPFVKGESLRDRLDREGQLPIEDTIQIVLEVADALGHAHSQNIVHRDIKPENILLSNGHALVADFGIARAASEGGAQKLTQTGMALGTPVYMAPEQAMGEKVGPTADIYSLGCMLYEMLAGEPPFNGKTATAIMARHAMEAVPSIRIVRSAVPEEVEDAIFAAMAKDPPDRPQTCAKFAEFFGAGLGTTATRRAQLRHTAARRIPTGSQIALGQQQTDPDHAMPPVWRRPQVIGIAAILLALIGAGSWWMLGRSARRTAGAADPTLKRIAVLYFTDQSSDQRLRPVADGLTEALIKTLGEVRNLTVISRNGVEPFRGTSASPDSIARALDVGTLVEGSVEPEGKAGDRVRVTTRIRDRSGSDVGRRSSFVVAANALFAAEDSVAKEVALTLREWVGQEIQLREGQAGTSSGDAWRLVRQGENLRRDASEAQKTDPAKAAVLFERADSVLEVAEGADRSWVDPVILRGELMYQRAETERDRTVAGSLVDKGLGFSSRALTLDANSPRALALRGSLEFGQWRVGSLTDQTARAELLKKAKADLESATRLDPSLASAFATLSQVDYAETPADVPSALIHARSAYEADAFVSNSDNILNRLFWASYDLEQLNEATKWCDEGARRFPRDHRFVLCQAWLMVHPSKVPDIARGWLLAAAVDTLAPPATRAFWSHLVRMVEGGIIGQAAKKTAGPTRQVLLDSAEAVLVRARGDRDADPEQELPGYEAVMRALIGDQEGALKQLKQYVSVNPDHSFEVAGNIHWWWRDLRANPGFAIVVSRRK